jgi:hypothetical protein
LIHCTSAFVQGLASILAGSVLLGAGLVTGVWFYARGDPGTYSEQQQKIDDDRRLVDEISDQVEFAHYEERSSLQSALKNVEKINQEYWKSNLRSLVEEMRDAKTPPAFESAKQEFRNRRRSMS